ncbi:unnamed protein product [Acanthoscelides obtectus]|uniref:DDE-1 domain-containing protein n=1 Tax=Acanthoscelides obtectus TaxID=200917 RepID=A0A9P0PNP1_ACAOB|nr:unnamed protein product [Acanthoscelides obtectus]CAK1680753.1 hypothetical protein AOBTE_LOCUS32864 [Acanthoscelides obtectus]
MVRSMTFHLAEKLKIKHKVNADKRMAGYRWFESFLRRNPELSIRKAEIVSSARATSMNKKDVDQYLTLLLDILVQHNLLNKASHIFNVDETGLQLNNKPDQVVAIKGSKNVVSITSAEKGETISIVACCSAEGSFIPPTCIFKGENKKQEYEEGMPSGATVFMCQKSAYINNELFLKWLKEQFVPRKPPGEVLQQIYGHTSHCNNIELANAGKQLNRLQFAHLLNSAWQRAATIQNAQSSFRATGIVPFNPSEIPEYAFLVDENQHVEQNIAPIVAEDGVFKVANNETLSRAFSPPIINDATEDTGSRTDPTDLLKDLARPGCSGYIASEKEKRSSKETVASEKDTAPEEDETPEKKNTRKRSASSLSSKDEELIYNDSFDVSDETDQCVGCGEHCNQTRKKDDWIECSSCPRWLRDTCSKYNSERNRSTGKKTRKSDSEMRKSLIQTGGGPPVKSEDNPINERVRSVVPRISYVIENEWDSNSVILSERQPNVNNTSENFITPQKKRKRPSVCGTYSTRTSLIEQEALLRIQKLKRSMEHDEELNLIKKQAAEAEKLYWETKLKKLNQ